jgi:murein L,D-transpeptidase YcbB/YkuD
MRSVVYAAIAMAAVAGFPGASAAAPVVEEEAGVAAVSSSGKNQTTSDLAAIQSELETRMDAARDPVERAFLSQINGHYREPDAHLLWVDERGLTTAGETLIEELTNADRYGLDPAAFELPSMPLDTASAEARAAAEADLSVAAVRYAWHARGGRVVGSQLSHWIEADPKTMYAGDVFRSIAAAGGDPAAGLRSFHPQNPQFERLRRAYLEERGDIARPPLPVLQPGDRVEAWKRHPDIKIIRQRLGLEASDPDNADLLDKALLRRIRSALNNAGLKSKSFVDDEVRAVINGVTPPERRPNRALLSKYVVNLERWRTMPEQMGAFYIWNNLPEFQTRVVKNGEVVHQERIIIGKPSTQTPVFSDKMDHIIFQPEWGVPESIKIRSLLPNLRGGDYGVLARRGMSIRGQDNRVISPSRFKWSKVDIRDVAIVQGPGPGNPLGKLKFMFPNHHAVYMHDTPDKYLFNSSERTFSHGCIRVRNPDKLAEVLLGEMEGWSASDVARQLKIKSTARIDLQEPIPVYNTYLTTWVNPDGAILQFKDIYGHDKRYSDALAGKSVKLIAANDPARALKKRNDDLRRNTVGIARAKPKPRLPKNNVAGLPPLAPWMKSGLGKPPKKIKPAASPPRLLWFQQY